MQNSGSAKAKSKMLHSSSTTILMVLKITKLWQTLEETLKKIKPNKITL